jgi:uncharacterized protein (DUF1501 family)
MSKAKGGLSRRELIRLATAGVSTVSASGWLPLLARRAACAAEGEVRHKSCILLWMSGGPSHKDTFDMKPGTAGGGEFRPIDTSVPGLQISEHFAKLAGLMHRAAVIRSMSTGEADHGRAGILMHTGFPPTSGGLKRPTLGAIVSSAVGPADSLLPNFVVCGQGNRVEPDAAGFLGPDHKGLTVLNPARGVDDLRPAVARAEFDDRAGLLTQLQDAFWGDRLPEAVAAQRAIYQRAIDLMRSDKAKALDLSLEPAAIADRYGATEFGQGCLLARRLVEAGVAFVEVVLPGWDTHQRNFPQVQSLSRIVDQAASALVEDLESRGLLETTLVIWMGEFGRTPRINNSGGRDHYARAWSTVLFGGGIPCGQVIGRTDREGAEVEERPVSVTDFMATVCARLGIDSDAVREGPGGRSVRLLNEGARPIEELL